MARSLPSLPALTEQDESEFDSEFQEKATPLSQNGLPSNGAHLARDQQDSRPKKELPRPIDLLVPPGKTSVVLTGPNTGESLALSYSSSPASPICNDGSKHCNSSRYDSAG